MKVYVNVTKAKPYLHYRPTENCKRLREFVSVNNFASMGDNNGKVVQVSNNELYYLKCITKAPRSYQYAYYNGEKVIILSVNPEHAVNILNRLKTIEVRKTKPRFRKRVSIWILRRR